MDDRFNIDPNDEVFAECHHCQIACKKDRAIIKKCFICKKEGYLHDRCAKDFYTWSKGVKIFDKKKFLAHYFKFFCLKCRHDSCHFCEKKHNVGEDSSFPVVCSEGHWLIVSRKCAPKNFKGATTRTNWLCKEHSVKEEKEEVEEEATDDNLPAPELILDFMGVMLPSELKDIFPPLPTYDKITRWSKAKKKKPFTFFHKLAAKDGFDMNAFHENVIMDFKSRVDYLHGGNMAKGKLPKNAQNENKKNVIFLKYLKENINDRQRYDTIVTNQIQLPYHISPYLLDILHSFNADGWLNDEIIGTFYSFLQEYVILENKDKDHKYPVIFLDTQCINNFHPQIMQWPHLDFQKLFDLDWVSHKHNLETFAALYKFWFEEKNAGNICNVNINNMLTLLEDKNEVSLLKFIVYSQIVHH